MAPASAAHDHPTPSTSAAAAAASADNGGVADAASCATDDVRQQEEEEMQEEEVLVMPAIDLIDKGLSYVTCHYHQRRLFMLLLQVVR
jgi:hypothetical protein